MNMLKTIIIVMLVFFGGSVLVGGCSVYRGYNNAVSLDEEVKSAWAQVENQLQRRFDLIDNLVETVKGIVGQEKDVFLGIATARKAYFQADSKGRAKANGIFESALSRLLVLRESYPELKSNTSFLKLQDQLEGTENRLGVERKRYNDVVATLNKFTRKLTGRFYSSLAGVGSADYFRIEEAAKAVPKVSFSKSTDEG